MEKQEVNRCSTRIETLEDWLRNKYYRKPKVQTNNLWFSGRKNKNEKRTNDQTVGHLPTPGVH